MVLGGHADFEELLRRGELCMIFADAACARAARNARDWTPA
jgi:hypothetical protein